MFAGFREMVSFPAFSLIYIPKYGVTTERNPNVSWTLEKPCLQTGDFD